MLLTLLDDLKAFMDGSDYNNSDIGIKCLVVWWGAVNKVGYLFFSHCLSPLLYSLLPFLSLPNLPFLSFSLLSFLFSPSFSVTLTLTQIHMRGPPSLFFLRPIRGFHTLRNMISVIANYSAN